jgi:alpha-tubulin suppressor-like RCC1 family protein
MKKAISLILSATMAMGFATSVMANSTTQSIGIGVNNVGLVTDDGQLVMWGRNEYGEFGNGVMDGSNYFDFTNSVKDVVAVVCGYYDSTAILKSDGTMWTCGRNNSGQLGNGTREDSSTFVKVASDVVKIGAGEEYFIYLKKDGTLWGMGNSAERRLLNKYEETDVKTPVKLMEGVKDFSTSLRNTAVITTNGDLYTFGTNVHGQLGVGSDLDGVDDLEQPAKVMSNVRSVSCGSEYMLAVKNDNTLWSWGTNVYAELMNDSSEEHVINSPKKVADNVLKACASRHNSAYITTDNQLYMVGENLNNELGLEKLYIRATEVTKIADNVKDVAINQRTVYTTLDGKTYTAGSQINSIGYAYEGWKEQPYKIADEHKYTVNATTSSDNSSVQTGNLITLQIGSNILTNNGKDTTIDVPAQIINGRTMVPLRAIFEALGADVQWDGTTQTVSSSKGSTDVSLQINSTELHKNSETKTLDVPAQLVEGRTLVPVRAIAEAYDCTVGWDSETKTVSVKY